MLLTRPSRCLVAVVVVAALVLPLVGCAGSGPLRAPLGEHVERPQPGVVLFLCDGLQLDLVERGCREGWLPNIQKRFVERGARVEHAITVVPAVTYAAITTLLTGVTPATHRVPGNHWFDPDQRLFRNYATIKNYRDVNRDFDAPTIYERIDPLFSVSIQAAHVRGVSRNIANWAQSGVRWYFGAHTGVDALTAKTVEQVAWEANWGGVWPALLTCYFPGLDTIGHLHGPSSEEYRAAAEHLDHHIGRVCDWFEAQGLLETTYIVLVSDHGMVDVDPDGHIDLLHLVRDEWGRNATDNMLQDGSFKHRRRYFDHFDTVVAHQDGRTARLHFAGPSGWDESPIPQTVDEILTAPPPEAQLWNLRGIDLVAYLASECEAVIRSPRGSARIVERDSPTGTRYRYFPVPDDMLGYQENTELAAFVAAGFHESRDWLRATCTQTFPDLVPQIIPLLRERRFGQVIIYPSPGYSFNREHGGHGGIRRDEMRVPMMFAGPGIEPDSAIECARTVDLVPTLMALLGVEPPDDGSVEGVSLFSEVPADNPVQP